MDWSCRGLALDDREVDFDLAGVSTGDVVLSTARLNAGFLVGADH
jgi:hypothetical protein